MKILTAKVVFCIGFLMASSAQAYSSYSSSDGATYRFGWSGIRVDHTTNYNGQTSTDVQTNHINTKFSYTFSNGIYLGALYEFSSFAIGTGTPPPDQRISYGPTLGFYNSGFYIEGTYFTNSTYTFANGLSYSGGSASQFEIGYLMNMTSNFYLGFGLTMANFSWNQAATGGISVSQTNNQSDTYPCLNLGFSF